MDSADFLINIFDYLLIPALILHFTATYFGLRFHMQIAKSISYLWCVAMVFPPIVPVAAYDTGSRASQLFKRRKINANVDLGIIYSISTLGTYIAFITGSIYFFTQESPDFNDFKIFGILITSGLLLHILGSAYGTYTYKSLQRSHKEWKSNSVRKNSSENQS